MTAEFSVTVDDDVCMGAGYCYSSYPELFTANSDDTSRLNAPASSNSIDEAEKASRICPSGAIEVHYRKDTTA